MPCYVLHDKAGEPVGHICGKLGPHCANCGDVSGFLCDYPVGKGKTCDRPVCERHCIEVAPDLHYCTAHHAEWQAFRDSGGVHEALANVVPFKQPELF